jgi:hypothetical protein
MRKTMTAALVFVVATFAGGAALAYGGHGGGGHGGGGGGGHWGGGGHGGGYHGHGWYGGWGYGVYGVPFYWPGVYGYGYYDPYYDGGDYDYYDEGPPPGVQVPPGPQQNYWYYCDASKSYYPYVKSCANAWQPVPAAPPPSEQPQ